MNKLLNDYEQYLNLLGKSEKTISSYLCAVRKFFRDTNFNSVEELAELDSMWFLSYANELKSSIKISTINKHIKQLSSFYQFLIVQGLCGNNPCYKLPTLNVASTVEYKEKVMTDVQAKAILKATEEFYKYDVKNMLRDKTIVFLMLNIAPRIEEVSKIRLEDLALENDNRIYIRGKGGNGKVTRYTNVNNIVKSLIIQLIQKNKGGVYLFENYKGEQLSTQTIRKVWYLACEIANIEGFNPHSVRHYVGSSLIAKGVEVKKVSQVLGHCSQTTTERYYIKPKDNMGEIIEVIDIF